MLALDIRALTDWLVQRHTAFGTLEAYFDGYAIAGDRLLIRTLTKLYCLRKQE